MSNRDESISSRDYSRLRELIYEEAGIALGTERKTMLEVRIKRRLKELAIPSYGEYCDYLFSRQGLRANWFTSSTWSPPTRPISFASPGTSSF